MLQLAVLFVLFAAFAVAKQTEWKYVPFSTTVLIHPRGQPNYCLGYVTTKNSYPYEFKLKMMRCNGQGDLYWKWALDTATDTWVLRNELNSLRCMAANATATPPQNGNLASITFCHEGVNEWQNWQYFSSSGIILIGPTETIMCLDRKDGNYWDGDVQLWRCADGNTNQNWDMECVAERQF